MSADRSFEFMREVQELAKKYGVNVSLYDGSANPGAVSDMADNHKAFHSIIDESEEYAEKLAKVFQDTITNESIGSLLGYTYGDIVNRTSMLLHVLTIAKDSGIKYADIDTSSIDAFLKSANNYMDANKQTREKEISDNAARLGKTALFCLGSLYPFIKSGLGNKPLLAGELLLILDYMSHIVMPHVIMGFLEHADKGRASEGEAFALPIDDMFKTLNSYNFHADSNYMVPKPNPELFDNCDCGYCTFRRLRAKYGAKTS